jgi:hypothetical protein
LIIKCDVCSSWLLTNLWKIFNVAFGDVHFVIVLGE